MQEESWFVARSHAMQSAVRTAEKAAVGWTGVLIVGEQGSGKRRLAKYIHHASGGDRILAVVDCAGPQSVLARAFDELMSATSPTLGGRCMLLLDRVDRLDDDHCAELTRAVWGGPYATSASLQVVATSRRSSRRLSSRGGGFLQLLARLPGEIRVPAVRHRGPDVPRLARFYLRQTCDEWQLDDIRLGIEAIDAMRAYDWPANAVEIQEVVCWAALAAESRGSTTIGVEDLPVALRDSGRETDEDIGEGLAAAPAGESEVEAEPMPEASEKRLILAAAEKHGGRRREMAAELGMSANTLWRRLRELGMVRRYRRKRTEEP